MPPQSSSEGLRSPMGEISRRQWALVTPYVFFFQAEDGIRDLTVTGVQTCALPIFAEGLTEPGAREVTASYRSSGRLMTYEGCSYLLPTVLLCEKALHSLANKEFMFQIGRASCRERV